METRSTSMGMKLNVTEPPLDVRTSDRVRRHTPAHVNERIDRLTRASIQESLAAGRDATVARIQELDREWDIDRVLMVHLASAGVIASELGRRHHQRWLALLRVQQIFQLMHAIIGWCPPVILLRRLGFRTPKEIAAERAALLDGLRQPSLV